MASIAGTINGAQQIPLAERVDVHKSCKSLELLVQALSDYAEAAAGIVALQRKLAKALKETAALKVTGEIASNALSASATLFETLSDIDSKFAKYTSRELEDVNADVRKWIKKLTKEEKLLDDRLSNANARIKQAGQLYEKKSKKNAREAGEEHARYINLISTLGPEVSQEKHKHALLVTQRHATTTCTVAACMSRVADAEWQRSCEGVKRFAPTIANLSQWRSFCEGAWMGSVPKGLPDEDEADPRDTPQNSDGSDSEPETRRRMIPSAKHRGDRQEKHLRPPQPALTSPTKETLREVSGINGLLRVSQEDKRPSSPASAETRHQIPAPSPRPLSRPPLTSVSLDNLPPYPDSGSVSGHDGDNFGTLSSFPSPPKHIPIPPLTPPRAQTQPQPSSSQVPLTPLEMASHGSSSGSSKRELHESPVDADLDAAPHAEWHQRQQQQQAQARSPPPQARRALPSPPPRGLPDFSSAGRGGDDPDEREFGVVRGEWRRPTSAVGSSTLGARGEELAGGNAAGGSYVAAMRSRYSLPATPKDVSRITTQPNVRTPVDSSMSDHERENERPLSPRRRTSAVAGAGIAGIGVPQRPPRRRDTEGEGEEAGVWRAREEELRAREREIEERRRALERAEARLMVGKRGAGDASAQNRISFPVASSRYSYSTTQLPQPVSSATVKPKPEHADFCGCEVCSVAKYKESSKGEENAAVSLGVKGRQGGARGWIRRLSMPGIGASSGIGKK